MSSENTAKEPAVTYGTITSLDQLDLSKRYSYADYFRWKFEERVELIKGFIYKMSPAPAPSHQKVSLQLTLEFGNFFKKEKCNVFSAPFDVRLSDSKKQINDQLVYTVVQPDICVICDPEKIDSRGCVGAPDLIIEILSPGNSKKEMGVKFDLYEENGVKEYWIVEPSEKVIYVYVLQDGKFIGLKPFIEDDEISPVLFPELSFQVKGVFE
jgi:Uma2 family endonuclease